VPSYLLGIYYICEAIVVKRVAGVNCMLMTEKQIDKGISYLNEKLRLIDHVEFQTIEYFQQLSITLTNFPNQLLYDILLEVIDKNKIRKKNTIFDETEFVTNINLYLLQEKIELKKYFETISAQLFDLQPTYKRTSTHNNSRKVENEYFYLIEFISDLLVSESNLLRLEAARNILIYYVCDDVNGRRRPVITLPFSKSRLKYLLSVWIRLKASAQH